MLNFLYKPHVYAIIQDRGMGKYKTEQKLVFTEKKMEKAKRPLSSGKGQQPFAKSFGTNKCTRRK